MNKRLSSAFILLSLLLALTIFPTAALQSEAPVIQALFFYSPSCPHCHQVIETVLPSLSEQYGEQLQILGVDTSQQVGAQLYRNAVMALEIPEERLGVPTLIVGDQVLVGSLEIPQQFPTIIESGLARGGIGWPEIPGLAEAVPDLPPSAEAAQPSAAPATDSPTAVPALSPSDLQSAVAAPTGDGFGLAWGVMIGMLLALLYAIWRLGRVAWPPQLAADALNRTPYRWAVPLLLAIGVIVAAYLAYVEVTQSVAVCGPVGDCNVVQSSPYAQVLGVPVALLGIANYLAIGVLWLALHYLEQARQMLIFQGLLLITLLGTLYSIYLTGLELFVIHAVCAWCLTSAVVTTLLMLAMLQLVRPRPSTQADDRPMAHQPR